MKSVCANCDLGRKRSDCSDLEYIECECQRWIIEEIKNTTLLGFFHVIDDVLDRTYENKTDLRNIKLRMIKYLSEGLIE